MKRIALMLSGLVLAGCGVQPAPETTVSDGLATHNVTIDLSGGEGIQPQGTNITGCVFSIAYPHTSSTVPGAVKVNATGNCPTSSESYTLEVTMILERCNDAADYCYAYKTGTTTRKTMTGTQKGVWYNQDLNSFTTCASANYRGRLQFRAWKADGTSLAVPLTEPVGYIRYVTC